MTELRMEWRVGQGEDIHALVPGRRLMLGGVEVVHHSGLLGHSDADALLHAIIDALLGAAGLGDIGTYFPDTEARWKGANSGDLLRETVNVIRAQGWQIMNVDSTVCAQAPRLAPYREPMRNAIAKLLDVALQQVNIKAKTAERLGFVGRQEGIATSAVCLLQRQVR
ncbi:MAG: 2-C-methyl-D-erythritol 2,4-cyclodiphosphate synthase [Proteobacteria bacterium]|nr:2-C-methyl-D-erythritol 2,4-cyclodiphosphate synthase [Pseudomonadota bacterium]